METAKEPQNTSGLENKFNDELIDDILGFVHHNKSPFIRMTGENCSGMPLMWQIFDRSRNIKKRLEEKQTVRLPYSKDDRRRYSEIHSLDEFNYKFYPLVLDDETELDLVKFYGHLRKTYCEKNEFLVIFIIDSKDRIRPHVPCPAVNLKYFLKHEKIKISYLQF
jgi:hypothetical protein